MHILLILQYNLSPAISRKDDTSIPASQSHASIRAQVSSGGGILDFVFYMHVLTVAILFFLFFYLWK